MKHIAMSALGYLKQTSLQGHVKNTVSLLKMASVLQHGVVFCSELGKNGFGNT